MPRQARQRSEKGIHHIVVQGKRGGSVFALAEDKELYLDTVLKYRDKTGMGLYAFCILDNHAHLVLRETEEEDVSSFMRRVGVSFAYWFRKQHSAQNQMAEIFRGRYMSETLDSEQEVLETVRYIHQEPVRLGLVSRMEEYFWSSYRLYLKPGRMIDRRLVMDSLHFSGGYTEYMQAETSGHFLEEVPMKYGRTEEEARAIVQRCMEEAQIGSLEEFATMDEEAQKEFLRVLRFREEISIQQISRITGVNRGIIQRL